MEGNDEHWMRRALELARLAREHGNHPFGALVLGADGEVLAEAENTVVTEQDCTGHAETNVIRLVSRRFAPEQLAGSTLYTSTEPCAMCSGAIYWSGVGRVVYGLGAPRFYASLGPKADELLVGCHELFSRASRPVAVSGPLLEDEALAVHQGFW